MDVRAFVLRGQGIECENETLRMLMRLGATTKFWDIPKILANSTDYIHELRQGDWIFIPGGFSFSDHLGSGCLLAFELNEAKFFEQALAKGASFWGLCNGFQVLTAAGLFGDVKLLHNHNSSMNFRDQWVKCHSPILEFDTVVPARHGEGRLKISDLAPNTQTFLEYSDPNFTNGSDKNIAGLIRTIGKSYVIGTMPHPEILYRPEQKPDFNFTDLNQKLDKSILSFILEAK